MIAADAPLSDFSGRETYRSAVSPHQWATLRSIDVLCQPDALDATNKNRLVLIPVGINNAAEKTHRCGFQIRKVIQTLTPWF
jgi:hypothetical protein